MKNISQKWINLILFVLLALNFCGTTYLIYKNKTTNLAVASVSFEKDEVLKKLVEKAVVEYNQKNFKGVYSLFDELAKIQMNDAETIQAFDKLSQFSGKIIEYIYVSSEKAGFQSGKSFYTVKYLAKFEGGTIGQGKGELKVTFSDSGTEKKLYYFGANANLSK